MGQVGSYASTVPCLAIHGISVQAFMVVLKGPRFTVHGVYTEGLYEVFLLVRNVVWWGSCHRVDLLLLSVVVVAAATVTAIAPASVRFTGVRSSSSLVAVAFLVGLLLLTVIEFASASAAFTESPKMAFASTSMALGIVCRAISRSVRLSAVATPLAGGLAVLVVSLSLYGAYFTCGFGR